MSHRYCKTLIFLSFKTPSNLSTKLHFPISCSQFFSSSSSAKPPLPDSAIIEQYLINQHGFSPETAAKGSAVITRIKTPEKSYSILTFLQQCGFSNAHLEKTVQHRPVLLASDLDNTIKPKIKLFQDSGFAPNDIAEIIATDPRIFTRSLDRQLLPSMMLLKRVLGPNVSIPKVLKLSGGFLQYDLEKTMVPNIEFLKSCGIGESQIMKLVYNFPRFFVCRPEWIKDCVVRVNELGLDGTSNMFLHAIRVVSSMTTQNWELKLDLFRRIGLSEDEILFIFRRAPHVFAVSEKKILKTVEFLLTTGGCDASVFAHKPELLVYSLESRIKPRMKIFEFLVKEKLVPRKVSLSTIIKMEDKKFCEKYASLCPNEVGELYLSTRTLSR